MKKEIIITSGIILLLAVIGIAVFFIYNNLPQNVIGQTGIGNDYDYMTVSQITDNPQYVEYEANWFYTGSQQSNVCDKKQTLTINFNVNDKPFSDSTRILFPEDYSDDLYQIPQTQDVYDIQMDNLNNQIASQACGDSTKIGQHVPFTSDYSGTCTLSETPSVVAGQNNSPAVVMNCQIKAVLNATQSVMWYGDLSGSAKVKFYKSGDNGNNGDNGDTGDNKETPKPNIFVYLGIGIIFIFLILMIILIIMRKR